MAENIIAEWDGKSLLISRSAGNDEPVRFESSVDPETGTADLTGLVSAVEEAGLTGRTVDLALARELVVLRTTTIPSSDLHEQPDLVRYRVSSLAAVPLDQLHVDYLVEGPADEGGVEVLAATITPDVNRRLRTLLSQLNWNTRRIVPAPCAVLATGEMPGSDDDPSCITVWLHGGELELIRSAGRRLISSHHAILPEPVTDRSAVYRREINRFLMASASASKHGDVSLIRMAVPAPEVDAMTEVLIGRFENARLIQIENREPLSGLALRGVAEWSQLASEDRIDFENRRTYAPPRNWKPILIMAAAASVILLMVGAWFIRSGQVADLNARKDEMNQMASDSKKKVRELREMNENLGRVIEWENGRSNWIAPIAEVREAIPVDAPLFLADLRLSKGSKTDAILANGRGDERPVIESVIETLGESDSFSVKPKEIIALDDDSDARLGFTLDLNVIAEGAE